VEDVHDLPLAAGERIDVVRLLHGGGSAAGGMLKNHLC
jgi:hypothetical protein